ncbi:VPS10 domain-containing protein [Carboxylicivirga sp. RSCT41]|uniref:VPS10 domain-containing protein n=1 Tax=Carboxylicivirga agarovorans TaxID=3417570 RepID=UPI003D337D27
MKKHFSIAVSALVLSVITFLFLFDKKLSISDDATNETSLVSGEEYPVWIDMMEQPDVNLTEARQVFDNYWEQNERFKGDRYKQFERWYAISAKRTNKHGDVISARAVSSVWRNAMNDHNTEFIQGNWYCYGPLNVGPRNGTKRDGGRVRDIEFHPTDPNTLYVSCFKSGLFKSGDKGESWEPLSDNLTEEVYVSRVMRSDPASIFIGTNLGVYKTSDEGLHWTSTSVVSAVKALHIHSYNENIITVGAKDGIYQTQDAGTSWTKVLNADRVEDIKVHPGQPLTMYAATNGTPGKFYRTSDGGQKWTEVTDFGQGCFMKIAVSPAQPDDVFVLNARDHMGQDSFEGFYHSTDGGKSFAKLSGETPCITGYKSDGSLSRGQPNYNLFVVVDPANASNIWAGGVKSWRSNDGGHTWEQYYNNVTTEGDHLHMDQLNWSYSPHDQTLFVANDGGIYYLNEEQKFQMITDGLPIAEIYECSQSQTVKSNVAGGTMHCGIKLNNNGIWYSPWGGDEATCIIDPSNENYIYHIKYEKVCRSSNGGFKFPRINKQNKDRGHYTGTGVLHKSDVNTLLVGFTQLQRTINARAKSVSWSTISSFPGKEKIQKVEQCESNHDILYVARGNDMFRSDNINADAPTYTKLTTDLPLADAAVNDIATCVKDESIVYILQGSNIYRSADKGATWVNLTNNLPGVALLEMVVDKSSDEGIYVGTDIGVFYKDASMTNWLNFSKGLPAIRVSGMEIYYGADREESVMTISTDGRGFWRSLLYGVQPQLPKADFVHNTEPGDKEGTIRFFDKSSNHPETYQWIFEGGEPSSSKNMNPVVTYQQAGRYKVELRVSNGAGMDSLIKEDYVTISKQGGMLQVRYE